MASSSGLPAAPVLPNRRLSASKPLVAIVVVNWNGWRDTILCLQSLFRMDYPRACVIVCDNDSSDQSVERIESWARNEVTAWVPRNHPARQFAVPRRKGAVEFEFVSLQDDTSASTRDAPLTIFQTGGNLGFAGGCNAGITYALARLKADWIWLLNNDTVVAPDALSALIESVSQQDRLPLASSRIFYLNEPAKVWFEGGVYSPLTASGRHVTLEEFRKSSRGFLSGCALLISADTIGRLGLLDDSFFMYGEDVDYCIRATQAGIPLAVVPESKVFHAEGASQIPQSASAYHNIVSSGVRLIKKYFHPAYLIPIFGYHVAKLVFLGIVRRRPRSVLRGYWQGLVAGLRQH